MLKYMQNHKAAKAGSSMDIIERHSEINGISNEAYTEYDINGSKISDSSSDLLKEYLLQVFINSTFAMKVVCTPTDIPALITGRLISEGIIKDHSDIRMIDICSYISRADVTIDEDAYSKISFDNKDTVYTCCTDNSNNASSRDSDDMTRLSAKDASIGMIRDIRDRFKEDTELHRITASTHSAILYSLIKKEIIFVAEDIGRHNALDKAIGYALIEDIPLSETAVFTTGRIPVDMVKKVIRAGIPILISAQQPTSESLDMARKYDLTLIGRLKGDSFRLYNGNISDS